MTANDHRVGVPARHDTSVPGGGLDDEAQPACTDRARVPKPAS